MNATAIQVVLFTDDGDEVEHKLPAKFSVCPTCEGRGTHVNRAIDGNGLSREDFEEDPDFAESYFRGDYDVRCEECKGARVVSVPDTSRMSFAQKRILVTHQRAERRRHAEDAADRRMQWYESGCPRD